MEECIFIELHDVDIVKVGCNTDGKTEIRVAISLKQARRLVDGLARELEVRVEGQDIADTAWRYQREWLHMAMVPDRNMN